MTRTTDTFGAVALAILTVFALWTSTLVMPVSAAAQPAATHEAPVAA